MSDATKMRDQIAAKNGVYPGTFKLYSQSAPVPITTNYDVISLTAYWFGKIREWLLSKELSVYAFQSVESEGGEGRVWHYTNGWAGDTFGTSTGADAPAWDAGDPNGLDVYLALPGFPLVDDTRDDPSVRFAPDQTSVSGTTAAAAIRARIANGDTFATGWLMTFDSKYEKLSDEIRNTYNDYLSRIVARWDTLIRCVDALQTYYILPHHGNIPGEMIGDFPHDKLLWETIADIEKYMADDQYVSSSQLEWGSWVSNAGTAVKDSAETVIQGAAKDAGAAAAWASNQAGQAAGGFTQAFFQNAGLWGLGFVATIILLKA